MTRKVLKDLAYQTAKHSAEGETVSDRYIEKILLIFEKKLTTEEKKYVTKILLESLHYKASLEDPERIAKIYTGRAKLIAVGALWTTASIIIIIGILGLSPTINKIFDTFTKLADLL